MGWRKHGRNLTVSATVPVDEKNFQIRFSTAVCNGQDSVFTDFSGFTRWISPKSGRLCMEHTKEDGSTKSVCLKPFEIDKFEGSWKTTSTGAYTDFNLLTDSSFNGDLVAIHGGDKVSFDPGKNFLAGFFCTVPSLAIGLNQNGKEEEICIKENEFLCIDSDSPEIELVFPATEAPNTLGFWGIVSKE